MMVTLPYRFDTSGVVKTILSGMLGLLLVVLLGILYSLLVTHDRVAALALLIAATMLTYFARQFFKNLTGSLGTITADAVIVEPVWLLGIRLAGPAGRFPITSFQTVRVDRISSSVNVEVGPHERVCLVGKNGVPDILIARSDWEAGRTMGTQVAAVLGLPYEERIVPY
jgi:hypothetical protein